MSAPSRLFANIDAIAAPVVLFVATYCAIFALERAFSAAESQVLVQWQALAAVAISVAACRTFFGNGNVGRRIAAPSAVFFGAAVAVLVIVPSDLLIEVTARFRHTTGNGFSAGEVLMLMVPAALHEELLFRGFAFRRLAMWHRGAAVALTAIAFAALHATNSGVGVLALLNIALGGVLLALVVLYTGRLIAAMATHVCWNVLSGPVLGHEVSGYVPQASLLRTIDGGPDALTGGSFGIEASLWLTLLEALACAWLLWRLRRRNGAPDAPVLSAMI